jgi:acetyl-CoA carboxylase carboxyl transferase subunit alpha
VPTISIIIGEGGSGGAIAIAATNRVYMLEHAVYSVISPEGAASILWRDTTRSKDAATSMKITAQDLLDLRIIDGIVPEPVGGAQRAPETVVAATGELIARTLSEFAQSNADFREQRREKFLAIGRGL